MKKILTVASIMLCLLLTACGNARSIGIIGGADGPTSIIVSEQNGNRQLRSEKEPVRAVMLGGSLYYETGEDRDMDTKCGTLDGSYAKAVDGWELPKNDNESNFEPMSKQNCGYQTGAVDGTIEVSIGDDWEIFKKLETVQDISKYKYILKGEGEIEGANDDAEYIILSNTLEVTANDVAKAQASSADTSFLVIAADLD